MRGRRARREERMALVARAQEVLPPEELSRVMAVVLAASVLGSVLELLLLVRTVRGVVGARRHGAGFRDVVRSGRVPRTLALLAVLVGNRAGLRALLIVWLRRSLRRAEAGRVERRRSAP